MNCPEFEEQLQRRLDGEDLADRGAWQAHLGECAACRERHAAATQLLDGLRCLPQTLPPSGLAERTVTAVLRDRRARARRRLRVGVCLALAASLLLAAFGLGWFDGLFAPDRPQVVEAPKPPPPPVPRDEAPLTRSLAEVQGALVGLADRLAGTSAEPATVLQVAAAPLELVSLDALPSVGPVTQPLEATGRTLRQGSQGATAASRAISGLTRRALNYFSNEAAARQAAAE